RIEMLNKTLLCAGVCLAFAAAGTTESQAAMLKSAPSAQSAVPAQRPAGTTVLYTQTGASLGGGTNQNFATAQDAYDGELADDFVVPAGGWGVNSVNFPITASAGGNVTLATWNITFYSNGAGIPGAADVGCTYLAQPGTGATAAGGTITVTLPTQCNLTAGTHWFSAQSNLDFAAGGQTFWSNYPAPAVGADAVFRNPGDGFATGCTTFTSVVTCAVGGSAPNYIFQLLGRTLPVTLQSYKVD
ncbi:MAG: hypothetical protein WAV67_06895, partial [Dokdonella sp.]